jgi:NAD(P) transhydrogenase subunit alpha
MKQDGNTTDSDAIPPNKVVGGDAPVNSPGASVGDMPNAVGGTDFPANEAAGAMQHAPVNEAHDAVQAHADMIADTAAAGAAAMGVHIDPFIFRLTIFVLAIFVGYYVVWSVTPALHTPLMSVTNAISSVIIVGALLAVAVDVPGSWFAITGPAASKWFGFFAVILASVNIFGGFLVTQRMLSMYKKKG